MTFPEDTSVPAEEVIAPSESEQADSESGVSAPQPTAREIELERRLRQQGQQLADLKRTNTQLSSDLTRINSTVTLLGESLTTTQRQADERRQREVQAYLESLPEPQRLREEVRLANERVARMEQTLSARNAATARPSVEAPSNAQQQETPEQYFRRRGTEIIAEVGETFGVTIDRSALESLSESDWNDEKSFTRAVTKLAARISDGEDISVAQKKTPGKAETPAEMEARITDSVKRSLGVASPASPRPAAVGRRGQAPTSEEVQAQVSTYDARKGPRDNIKKLRELREKMG